MIEMVSRRAEQALNYDYQKMARDIRPTYSGWNTPEEYFEKVEYQKTPEIELSRVVVQNTLSYWEKFKPLMLSERESMGNPEAFKDLEYLYDAMKKKYPNLSGETQFWWTKWFEE